ncbi:T3SS effector NleG family protein [Escherichia coli]|nr:T3SS effector NleG family protein [Escherichia coli]
MLKLVISGSPHPLSREPITESMIMRKMSVILIPKQSLLYVNNV